MNNLEVLMHAQDISDVFWRNLGIRWQAELRFRLPYLDNEALIAENLRQKADYNTGSVPTAAAAALLILAAEIKPERVFEIGTFIGNSTRALALHSKHVYTCDGHNDLGLGLPNVTQYRKIMSTAALQAYKDLNIGPVDLFFLDGRIQAEDAPLLCDVTNDETIFVLDDCYQLEKGTMNTHILGLTFKDRALLYLPPPRGEPFKDFGVPGGMTVGMVMHMRRFVLAKA